MPTSPLKDCFVPDKNVIPGVKSFGDTAKASHRSPFPLCSRCVGGQPWCWGQQPAVRGQAVTFLLCAPRQVLKTSRVMVSWMVVGAANGGL